MEKYKNIKIAIWIFYLTQIIGLVKQSIRFSQIDLGLIITQYIPKNLLQFIPSEQLQEIIHYYTYAIYAGMVVSFFGMIYVIYETSRGKQWARILLLISSILAYIFIFAGLIFSLKYGFDMQELIYKIVICSLEIVALVLLFKKDSSSYFEHSKK